MDITAAEMAELFRYRSTEANEMPPRTIFVSRARYAAALAWSRQHATDTGIVVEVVCMDRRPGRRFPHGPQ